MARIRILGLVFDPIMPKCLAVGDAFSRYCKTAFTSEPPVRAITMICLLDLADTKPNGTRTQSDVARPFGPENFVPDTGKTTEGAQ